MVSLVLLLLSHMTSAIPWFPDAIMDYYADEEYGEISNLTKT